LESCCSLTETPAGGVLQKKVTIMKAKVRLLNFVVSFTLILLTIGAMLVVLGLFNEGLHWDIFGPKLEAVLYGVFGSCMALAGFGVAMTVIIAIQESVKDFKKFVQSRTNQQEVPDATRHTYLVRMFGVVCLLAVLVGICSLINHRVLTQRCKVFKGLAGEQVGNFEGKIIGALATFSAPPTNDAPRDLYDVLKTLNNLDFINHTTLYIADPAEASVLWSFVPHGEVYTNTLGFTRLYVAKDFEKRMLKALAGDVTDLGQINSRNDFVWYAMFPGNAEKPRAVLRIDGDSRQSFREYRLGN
jgi:hypothetical protein